MFDLKRVGERLKIAREEMNYTQKFVAEFIGKTREQISYYETGNREISISLLIKLANLYGKSIDYFLQSKMMNLGCRLHLGLVKFLRKT